MPFSDSFEAELTLVYSYFSQLNVRSRVKFIYLHLNSRAYGASGEFVRVDAIT